MAERRGVVFAFNRHEPVISLGESGVDLAGVISAGEERLAKAGITGFGRSPGGSGVSGVVTTRDEPGERSNPGEVPEPLGVAETTVDPLGANDTDAGSGPDDAGRVRFGVESTDAFVHHRDLLAQRQREASFGGDVGSELAEVELVAPQLDRCRCGGDDLGGSFFGPCSPAGSMQEVGEATFPQLRTVRGLA